MVIDTAETARLIDRMEIYQRCVSPTGGVWSREECLTASWSPLKGRDTDVPTEAEWPTKEQCRSEPQKLGQQLAIAAVERGIDSEPFEKVALFGWRSFNAENLLLRMQELRTKILIEFREKGTKKASRGRRAGSKSKDTIEVEEMLKAGDSIEDIVAYTRKTRGAVEKIELRWRADGGLAMARTSDNK